MTTDPIEVLGGREKARETIGYARRGYDRAWTEQMLAVFDLALRALDEPEPEKPEGAAESDKKLSALFWWVDSGAADSKRKGVLYTDEEKIKDKILSMLSGPLLDEDGVTPFASQPEKPVPAPADRLPVVDAEDGAGGAEQGDERDSSDKLPADAEARIAALPTVEQVDDDIMSRIDSGKCDSMGIIKTLRRVLDERDDLLRDIAARAEKAEAALQQRTEAFSVVEAKNAKAIADLTRERDAARRDARKLARRLLADLCAPKWEERAGGIIQVEGRDEMRDELEKLRKYALLDSTHWEKLDYRARQRIAALSEPDGEQAPEPVPFEGDPKECAFPEGWSPPQPRPDYVPPDREGDEVLHRFRLGFRNINNINGPSMRDRDETLNELCRRGLARGEGGR
jgi:hypothetical protein